MLWLYLFHVLESKYVLFEPYVRFHIVRLVEWQPIEKKLLTRLMIWFP